MKTAIIFDTNDGAVVASASFDTEAHAVAFGQANANASGRGYLISDGFASPDTHRVVAGKLEALDTAQAQARLWRDVRSLRRALLADSDWIVTSAMERGDPTPLDWQTYRQALRDITLQPDPSAIVWPIPPAQ